MKISVAIPALDLAPPAPPASSSGASAAGQGFETAVRAVAEKAGDRGGAPAGAPPPPPPERERVADGRKEPAPAAPAKAKDEGKQKDDETPADASTAAPTTPAADLLGRLLAAAGLAQGAVSGKGGQGETSGEDAAKLAALSDADAAALAAAAAAAAGEAGTTFDGALHERLVITPLGSGGTEAKAEAAGKGRAGVGLEVLRMETHFEPRAGDVVLVEGAAEAGAEGAKDALDGVLSTMRRASTGAVKGAQGSEGARKGVTGVTLRFDEALARLSSGEAATGSDADASEGRGAKGGRKAEAKTSDEARFGAARAVRAETAVKVETGEAMPVASSMTSQIADRIIDAFRPSSGQERMAEVAPGTTHLRMTAGGAALKTLTIQLQPENLGKLDVSMRLVEGRLTLELAASSAETAVALSHDKAGLKKLLEHAGFSMDEASITIVARDAGALSAARAGDAPDAGGQGQQAATGGGRGGSDASSGGERGLSQDTGAKGGDASPGGRGRGRGEGDAETPAARRASVFL